MTLLPGDAVGVPPVGVVDVLGRTVGNTGAAVALGVAPVPEAAEDGFVSERTVDDSSDKSAP
jgi:hypothetical protein